jgi:hypothetical protein
MSPRVTFKIKCRLSKVESKIIQWVKRLALTLTLSPEERGKVFTRSTSSRWRNPFPSFVPLSPGLEPCHYPETSNDTICASLSSRGTSEERARGEEPRLKSPFTWRVINFARAFTENKRSCFVPPLPHPLLRLRSEERESALCCSALVLRNSKFATPE